MRKHLKHGTPEWFDKLVENPTSSTGFDHIRTYKGKIVISQPYGANEDLVQVLAKLADHVGINFHFLGVSPYYPGRTFSIIFWRDWDSDLAWELMHAMEHSNQKDWR